MFEIVLRTGIIFIENIPLIGVQSGDSWGISVTGEIPQERSDEEAHRTPPGKRPLGTEINSYSVIPIQRDFFSGLDISAGCFLNTINQTFIYLTGFHLRRNNVFPTTDTELNAMAPPARIGFRSPIAATGIRITL